MNKALNIKRLAQLIVYENKSSNFILNIIAGMLIYTVICVLMRYFNNSTHHYYSIIGRGFVEILLSFSPILCYYKLILKKEKRALYCTLPATGTEKYLSMLVNTLIIAPATIIIMATIINYTGSLIYSASNYTVIEIQTQPNHLLYILINWSWISSTTLLLLIFAQFRNWKGITIALAIPIGDIALAAILISRVDGNYITPTTMASFMNIISITNLIVIQALIYKITKRIRA